MGRRLVPPIRRPRGDTERLERRSPLEKAEAVSDDRPAPAAPPIATSDLPGTGGTIGPLPEDFQVDEVPLYAPSGDGEHLYVRVTKRRLTTREAVSTIARAAGVPTSEI